MSEADEVRRLADLAGILSGYSDQSGRQVETPLERRRVVLEGLGFPTQSAADRKSSLAKLKALRERPLPRVLPCPIEREIRIPLRQVLASTAQWSLRLESGEVREGRVEASGDALLLAAVPAGYHRLILQGPAGPQSCLLVAAPPRCWQPDDFSSGGRGFGFTCQIYGLRSSDQLGIGDYSDVARLAEGLARQGASFLGLSPAHALFPADPARCSPYSPSSRLFLNTSLIAPSAIDECSHVITGALQNPLIAALAARLRASPLVDYPGVLRLKRDLFEAGWSFVRNSDLAEFQAFRREGGEPLERHALFEAISEQFAGAGSATSDGWPGQFRDATSSGSVRFRKENAEGIKFHAWLQWIADRQLRDAQQRARASGMSLGLYRDLAVGSDRGGSEIWSEPQRYLSSLSIGAPPDPIGPQGQDWGVPPFDPIALEEQDLLPFRDLVRANMRHAGALRIDHAFQLRRLFLVPAGGSPADGAYVAYPLEALLGVLRVESHRAKCLVIAEDLGTAPKGFSDAVMRAGILSYRLLTFERRRSGGFAPPGAYPREALAAISTHDLPTFKGWWRGADIDTRECFGFYSPEMAEQERSARNADRRRLAAALRAERLPVPDSPDDAPMEGAIRFLARAPSALAAVQIEDALGETQQANLPGPDAGHPNWRRRLSLEVGAVIAEGGPAARIAAAIALEGRGLPRPPSTLARRPPTSTYRLQLNRNFGFAEAAKIAPYLRDLGVSHVYASPITRATPGSVHGYDVEDYGEINPELGGKESFLAFSDALRAVGLGLIVDFVPNHMGIAGPGNAWWRSVLEWGERSPHARAFDIDFDRASDPGRVMLPVLGKPYSQALADGEFALRYDASEGAFVIAYFNASYPVRPEDYGAILLGGDDAGVLDVGPALAEALEEFDVLRSLAGEELLAASRSAKSKLVAALAANDAGSERLRRRLAEFAPADEAGRRRMDLLLRRQRYRLAFWRLASKEINYRRFFDIPTLASVRVEDPEIFSRVHKLIFELAHDDRIQGLRIDHVDGLADPAHYLDRLQTALGPGFYLAIEKILEPGERLRSWPVVGTTGYDVLGLLDQVFVARENRQAFDDLWANACPEAAGFKDQLVAMKAELAERTFGGETSSLVRLLRVHALRDGPSPPLEESSLRAGVVALMANFPVYRTYVVDRPDDEDREILSTACEAARRWRPDAADAVSFISKTLSEPARTRAGALAVQRLQQLTGPLMAKSLEDTLFFRYGRLLALNEVGGDPARFGMPVGDFHKAMEDRRRRWPHAMTATSTHDVKRGEDARARLLALSHRPDLWARIWSRFSKETRGLETRDAYILTQSLIAAWPVELLNSLDDSAALRSFERRALEFSGKALREAKLRTSWTEPDETYEAAVRDWIRRLFDRRIEFAESLPDLRKTAELGFEISLARTVVKCMAPGAPDFYQGSEWLDLAFVDPDNRHTVDYAARAAALAQCRRADGESMSFDLRKQFVVARLLAERGRRQDLFAFGDYRALAPGLPESGLLAFERTLRDESVVTIARTRLAAAKRGGRLILAPGRWRNLLVGATFHSKGSIETEEILGPWPATVLTNAP